MITIIIYLPIENDGMHLQTTMLFCGNRNPNTPNIVHSSDYRIDSKLFIPIPATTVKESANTCPAKIEKIASAVSGTAVVDLALTGNTGQLLELPIGKYNYTISQNGVNCTQLISIIGKIISLILCTATCSDTFSYPLHCPFEDF